MAPDEYKVLYGKPMLPNPPKVKKPPATVPVEADPPPARWGQKRVAPPAPVRHAAPVAPRPTTAPPTPFTIATPPPTTPAVGPKERSLFKRKRVAIPLALMSLVVLGTALNGLPEDPTDIIETEVGRAVIEATPRAVVTVPPNTTTTSSTTAITTTVEHTD